MILPVLTAIVIVFIVWINYEIHKTTKLNKDDIEKFWTREKDANLTPRADLSSLNYITISTGELPIADSPDPTVNSYRDAILELSGKPAINLSPYSNTELKNLYGAANISLLSDYDNNYTRLVSILQKWAQRLYSLDYRKEALTVLEYAISCHTDVTHSYLLLAQIYKQENQSEKIADLIHILEGIELYHREDLIKRLSSIMNS